MKHLGDITKIKGCNAPVVDCIIGGSPCQDLSVAGKRAGLAGERSGLYMEQIRIIKEMRHEDEQHGRTGESIRPRYMVWENVPGAFSSNKGKDFAAVLEEAIRVAEPEAPDVPVPEKGWPTSGCIMGDSWSVAWRVLDAQFWGVPQRRCRIALVADFGGQSAHEILFVRKGLSGNSDESQQTRKAAPRNAQNRSGADDRARAFGCDTYNYTVTGDKACTLNSNSCITSSRVGPTVAVPTAVGFPLGFRPENVRCYDEVATTLCNGTRPGFTTGVIQPVAFDTYNMDVAGDKTVTLRAGAEHNYAPVFQPIIAVDQGGGKSGANFHRNLMTCTHGGEPAVAYQAIGFDTYNQTLTGDKAKTLNSAATDADHIPCTVYSVENHPADSRVDIDESGKVQTLTSRMGTGGGNVPMVMEPVGFDSYNLCTTGQDVYCIGNGQVDQLGLSEKVGTLNCMHDQQAVVYRDENPVVLDRAFFNQGENAKFDPQFYTDGTVPTLVARGPSAVQVRYIVRRLTPLECERLQGFPDGWTDIGEWVDSKGKKHKEADSPRYKALGNSIAIPPWKWVLKRLCACYERDATMASLFDGIGGFPYIWEQLNGKGSCLWASEIEEFPMAVTKLRFGLGTTISQANESRLKQVKAKTEEDKQSRWIDSVGDFKCPVCGYESEYATKCCPDCGEKLIFGGDSNDT